MKRHHPKTAKLSQSSRPFWRRAGAAALLACTLAGAVPAGAQEPTSNEAVLNFVNADIDSVIKAIGHYTNSTYLIDPRVKGTITLVTEKPVTKAQASQLLASALRVQGYAVVNTGTFTKVVPEADAKLQSAPVQNRAIRGDQVATEIFRLNYESAVNLVPVLRPLISPNNTVNADPGTNSLVITDYADNLRRLAKIIASLDVPASSDLDFVPIRHAVAIDIATMGNRLLDGAATPGQPGAQAGAAAAGATTLMADPRTNSVIIRAPSQARATLARQLIAKLDQPTALPGNVHVVYLKNAEAIKLAQTLRAVIASDSATTSQSGGGYSPTNLQTPSNPAGNQSNSQTGGGLTQTQGPLSSQQNQSQTGPLPTGGPGGFIQADAATNSLIITANEAVYRNLRSVIDQLDARRAQVYVESLIVEITAKRAAEFGIQWAGLSGDGSSTYRVGSITGFSSGGNNLISQLAQRASGASAAVQPPGNGINFGLFRQINGQLTLGAIARALETDSDANILSTPNLITLDNEEARIIVGQNVPFVTGQYTTQASGGAAGVNPFQTVERKDIGLMLRVRPQVSEGGLVKMAIYQETSAIQDQTNPAGIITTKRSIDTNVLVDDGEIIVLGGLIDDRGNNAVEKVPGLGDIPVIGNLFKYQNRDRTKTNLMVFLRPIVVRTGEQSSNLTADRYDYIRGRQIAAQPDRSMVLPSIGTPVMPALQNGRPMSGDTLSRPPAPVAPRSNNGVQPGNSPSNMPLNGAPQATTPAAGMPPGTPAAPTTGAPEQLTAPPQNTR
ncbi:type II secretion system secretin GspD [Noviherbaspirillum pedocola]|uniref:Type II secretion system secretin GspD n=1 Tax=Noviherbaspirillum pedocola TaxID=2801341 RepID=A0A934W863_9BURK|nr:type II secretion system secretin GspD [Noviherbaspirillum pedocola]MBK4736438.1 type II secretion system secretin GspD [Noviherbaspirillum pedocola]